MTRQVVQRSAGTGDVTVAGTVSASGVTATLVQARFVPRAGCLGTDTGWVTVGTGNSFSGNVTLAEGFYDMSVQAYQGTDFIDVIHVDKIGCGDVFIIFGQSLAANNGSFQYTPTSQQVSRQRITTGVCESAADPQPDANGSGGTPWGYMADALVAHTGLPVMFINVAIGGTSIQDWKPGATPDLYTTKLKAAINLFPSKHVLCILMEQGQNGAAPYEADLTSIIDQTRTDFGYDVYWGIVDTGIHPSVDPTTAAAQHHVATTYLKCFSGSNADGLDNTYRYDGTHWNQAGQQADGEQWAAAIIAFFSL